MSLIDHLPGSILELQLSSLKSLNEKTINNWRPTPWIGGVDPPPVVVDHDVSEDDRFNIGHRIALRVDLVQLLFL